MTLNRTHVLVCALLAQTAFRLLADPLVYANPKLRAPDKISLKAYAFDLRDVRLLDGPFRQAMELDHRYLLSLDADRLLHNFRVNAGLPSTARPLGGWEEPKCEVRGHFVGHYLSACALMYASTGDNQMRERANYIVAEMAKCQAAIGSGYLSAYPEEFLDRVEALKPVWAPYYTLHKILAGLLDVYVLTDNAQALEAAQKFADWIEHRNAKLTDEQMQKMLSNEHGGMNEVLANLYGLTAEPRYLKLAERFNHLAVLDPAAKGQDKLTGLHANTQIPKFIGTAREYELTGESWYDRASSFFWNTVVKERSYVIGGHSDGEGFTPKEKLSQALGPNTTETCNTYNMLKLTRHLFCWDPQAGYADYYERALYNHILASQNPDTGMMCYYVPLRSGSRKEYNTPNDSFWCCTGTGVENHAKYGDSIYFHDGGQGLFVNLFIASELKWKNQGVQLRQDTRYPDGDSTKLTFTCEKSVELKLHIRHPYWAASGFQVRVNGETQSLTSQPGGYVVVVRTWASGDTVEISFPMSLRTEAFRDNPHRLALMHGPLVLCAPVEFTKPIPAIVAEDDHYLAGLKPVEGKPSTFTAPLDLFRFAGQKPSPPVTFEPFYKMDQDRHYVVYWDTFTPSQWREKETEYQAELDRQKQLAVRTVDQVKPGEEQNEREHQLQGERTNSGDFGDRKFRHATDGGWFAYSVKVLAGQPQELWVTYWGSDAGNRVFDVLVDGEKIATQRLSRNRPEQMFDQVYPLPARLLQGKDRVTIKFQAGPGQFAGGVFGLRVVKSAGSSGSADGTSASAAQLTVQVDRPGIKISPMLYGLFFEEINHAGDGGLYAELVRNRSFEDSEKPAHWKLVASGAAKAEYTIDSGKPLNPYNRRSLRWHIDRADDGQAALVNEGFWGIPVVQGARYTFSLSGRCGDGFRGPLQVTLQSPDREIYAEGTIEGLTNQWQTIKLTLTAKASNPKAQLRIRATQPGTVWLDMVSLAPEETWHNRPNGLRPDLANMLSALRPAFVRFPGGCWVEGEELKTSYRWKETVGDLSHRHNQWNLWQYYSTHGLGYLEYLILCEDLGAEPLFVINCGMSHREAVPLDQMGPLIQDALDAIEYANGPTTTVWGGLRAQHGHLEPFHLKYLEIGNENGGPLYQERYALIYDAIKRRYPQVNLVANEWGGTPTNRPVEIVDEHYYSSPEFFINNSHRYDSYKRNGAKVYVGEYAVTQGCGQGNLRAAIGEAAFMTGMERNSDVVIMASYAPLFANVNYKKWNPDLINFDSSRAYGIPSYYVQKLFGENRGDVILPVTLDVPVSADKTVKRGKIGLGTWLTQAEYKDIVVTKGDEVLYRSDFTQGSEGWKANGGDWQVVDGVYRQTSLRENLQTVTGDSSWTDYTYSLKARKLGGAEGFLILFDVQDENNWVWWNIGGWGNQRTALERSSGGGKSVLGTEVAGHVETGKWYDIRVELRGNNIRCFLDGKLIQDVKYPVLQPLHAVANRVSQTGEVILKVVNASFAAQTTTLHLKGAKIDPHAKLVVLTSENANDENTLAEPNKVAPVTGSFDRAAADFTHEFPANSLTILRFQTTK